MMKYSYIKIPPSSGGRLLKTALFVIACFMLILSELSAQNTTITGTVKSSDLDDVLPGATVLVKGTNIGTATNIDGKFTISATADATLVFSSIGYIPQEVKVGNQTSIQITLTPDITNMEEVVVIGYGTVKKRDLTGAVTSVKSEEIRQVPAQNPLESIQGKIAGVDITRGNGSSSSGINIRIRGNRSIGASNNPLFIVDGVQTGSIDNINPNDIESMEFLKDASSTAIYGWQGANGIVIITTKKGSSGKPSVTLNSYYGVSEVSRYPSVLNGDEYVAIKREANRTTGKWNSVADDPLIFNTQELAAIANGDWIDYQSLLLSNGNQQNYNLGVNSGGDRTKVYTSLDFYGENGILKFDNVKRYTLRTNVDHTFNSWIKAGMQAQVANRDESYRRDPLNMANKIIPLGTVYDENGDFIVYPLGGSSISPLADEQPDIFSNKGKITNVLANVYLELKPFEGFNSRTNFGTNINNTRVGLFEASNSISRNGGTSRAQYTASNSRFINWDNVINYQKEIKDHSFAITALSSFVQEESDNVLAQGENQLLPGQLFFGLGNAPDNISINSGFSKWNVLSFAARLNYSYKGKYLITLTDRADGASRLSKGNKWAYFPSAAFAWRVVDENFMQNVAAVSELKLRLSYGVAGNSGIKAYGTQSSLTRIPMAFGESSFQGFTFSPLLGNPDAGWELSETTNFGIDLGLWRSRINATMDIYDTRTSDLLLPRGLPPTSGVQQVYQNIGKTKNQGVEIGINSLNIENENLQWETTLTFTRNREEIVSLVTEGVDDIGNGWFVGQPISVFYDYEKLGIWQTNEADEAAVYGQVPGDIKVKDQNGDMKIDAVNDRRVLAGNNRPDWFGGLNNKITYKRIDFSVYLFARWGQTIDPDFLGRYDRQSNLSNSTKVIDYWTPENPTNEYPRPNAGVSGSSTLYWSTIGYVDGSYLRVRNLSLGYTLPSTDKSIFSNMRIYFSGSNLFTFTKSKKLDEYDPERGGGESYPMLKNYVFGINLGF